jgi:hypothetical protein
LQIVKSGIQKDRIRWHCSQIKITMGFSFAHGTQKGGSWQPCGDYRRLNLVTTPDKFPVPNMQTFPMVYTVAQFFQKFILSRVITKFLSRPRTFQKLQS